MDSSTEWTEIGPSVPDLARLVGQLADKVDALVKRIDLLEARNREVLAQIQYQRGIDTRLSAGTLPFDTDRRAREVNLALRRRIPFPLEKSRSNQ